jgi:hypothetical protein
MNKIASAFFQKLRKDKKLKTLSNQKIAAVITLAALSRLLRKDNQKTFATLKPEI